MGNDTMSEKYEEEPKSARDTGNVSLNGLQAADQPNRIRMVVTVIENGNIPEALRLSTFLGIAQEPAYRALLLTCIKESQWWRDPTDGYGPYRSFDECAKEVTGLGRSSYGDLIRAWQRWHDKHKKTAEEWMRHCLLIGWAKCRDIGSADIPSDKIDAVVEEISRRGLKGKALTEYLQRYNPNYRSNREQKTNSVQKGPKPKQKETSSPDRSYSIDDILRDGCFLERTKLEKILERLHDKKNLILQGPPGTGKTWLAKRFAFALIGQRDDSRVRAVQFHPNLLYEDFVRGYRPAGDGKLSLADGPFLEVVNTAKDHSASIYVVVIEEINRGNPAQIFGEMLTLLEADKRTPDYALELGYRREKDERVFIPDNLYVIGTMNIADRSLALVDLALRRRFAFINLEPVFGEPWHNWVHEKYGVASDVLTDIEKRIQSLNDKISVDNSLGPQFRIGHSFCIPLSGDHSNDGREWFRQVVETEIGPHLNEIWSDDLAKAQQARQDLLKGF